MPISWDEIRHNAIKFSRAWKSATSELADKQTFWDEFFGVFGILRKTVSSFEVPVLKNTGNFGKINQLWKNKLLVEHKSAGGRMKSDYSYLAKIVYNNLRKARLSANSVRPAASDVERVGNKWICALASSV